MCFFLRWVWRIVPQRQRGRTFQITYYLMYATQTIVSSLLCAAPGGVVGSNDEACAGAINHDLMITPSTTIGLGSMFGFFEGGDWAFVCLLVDGVFVRVPFGMECGPSTAPVII